MLSRRGVYSRGDAALFFVEVMCVVAMAAVMAKCIGLYLVPDEEDLRPPNRQEQEEVSVHVAY